MATIGKEKQWIIFSIAYWILSLFILLNFNGTGQEADSINHFLHAKYAPHHLELYFNHWAKPLFTLLASPFAQFGFVGIKVFNILCAFGASYFSFKIAKKLGLQWAILVPFFYFIFPISFTTTFSGLTEPLCALFLSAGIYLVQHKKYQLSALLISFTPFIRSEGLIFIGVFGLLFLFYNQKRALFLLLFGHLLYTAIGFLSGQDFLWVFTKIPYASLSSHYGSGSLFHFTEKLNYLMGIPLLILFILGILYVAFHKREHNRETILVLSLFLAFFVAHSLFWYLEIFNSMGLKRVFAAVTPLMAIIALYGFNWFFHVNNYKLRLGIAGIVIAVVSIFPFTKNPAAMDWKDLNRTEAQENAALVAQYIQPNNLENRRFIYTDPFLSEVLRIDPFNEAQHLILATTKHTSPVSQFIVIENHRFTYKPEFYKTHTSITPGITEDDVIIWDNWHSIIDYGVHEELLAELNLLQEFKRGKSTYKVYRKKI